MVEAMDLVDEEDIAFLQAGENRRQIPLSFDDRPGGHLDSRAHLVGDDIGQSRLAETGKAVKKHMVERFAAGQGRLDEDSEALAHLLLADIIDQPLRPQGMVVDRLPPDRFRIDQAVRRR